MKSKELEEMIRNKAGYRTESFRGSGVRNLERIIRFEISMGNGDIVDFMKDSYKILKLIESDEWEDFIDECQNNIDYVMDEIIGFLERKLECKREELIGLWLAPYSSVVSFYNNENNYDIDKHTIDKNFIVISDLGNEGALFAFKKKKRAI